MQKYSRTQEKQNLRNIIIENQEIWFEEIYSQFDDSNTGTLLEWCNCELCLFIRMEELKIRLYQKHKNKPAQQKLEEFLRI
ncbi:MAG TPA: hypothetical protein PLQ20_01200 [Candidatus Paceibacterota bacterium]|nr:hypothetical protein [Candidatus Paceibacterota bacterium]